MSYTALMNIIIVFFLVGYPLCVVGGVLGKNTAGNLDAPCRTKHIAREIPPVNWYHSIPAHCAIGGFLPFR